MGGWVDGWMGEWVDGLVANGLAYLALMLRKFQDTDMLMRVWWDRIPQITKIRLLYLILFIPFSVSVQITSSVSHYLLIKTPEDVIS